MKTLMKSKSALATIVAIIVCVATYAQHPESNKREGGKGGRGLHERHGNPRGHDKGGLRVLSEYKGTLADFTYNEEKAYNGFTLTAEGQNLAVRFAPHLAKEIMAMTKKGNSISIMGFKRPGREGTTKDVIVMNSITSGSKTVYDHKPSRDGRTKEEFTKMEGKITTLAKTKDGNVNGIYLDKTLVRFAPYVAFQLGDKLSVGKPVTITGTLRNNQDGEVFVENTKVIKAQTLTLDGTTYAVR